MVALNRKYKVEVTNGPFTVVMHPANKTLKLGYSRDGDKRFFRKVLKTQLRFIGADFDFFRDAIESGICNQYPIKIFRTIDGQQTYQLWYEGTTAMSNGKFDYDRAICELLVEPEDVFTCINSNLKTKVNFLDYGTPINCYNAVGTFETVVCQDIVSLFETDPALLAYEASIYTPIDCIPGGASAGQYIVVNQNQYVLASLNDMSVTTEWIREVYFGAIAPDDSFTLLSAGKWARPAALMPGEIKTDPTNGNKLLNRSPNNLQRYYYFGFLLDYGKKLGLDNGRKVREVLPLVVDTFNCDLAVASDFFNINPPGDSPANLAYDRAVERLTELIYYQRSDIVRWDDSNNATKLEMTFEDWLNSLTGPLNCAWTIQVIDDIPTLRIEHVSYFTGTNQNDFTTTDFYKYIRGLNQFDISAKDDIPKYDQYAFGESGTDYFRPSQILYQGCSPTADSRENTFSLVSNDLSYLSQRNPASIQAIDSSISERPTRGDDGITFVAIYEFEDKNYTWNDHNRVNGALSWRDILVNYWLHERPTLDFAIITGTYSDVYMAESLKRLKKQIPVILPISTTIQDDFNPSLLQKTGMGWGEVQDAEFDTLTNSITLTLLYP